MRTLLAAVLLCSAALVSIALSGCEAVGIGGSEGAKLWREHCARCHGAQGTGTLAYNEYATGINLRDDDWKFGGDEGTMVDIVLQGVFPAMPAFDGTLTEAQIRETVRYIRTLRGD